MISQDEVMAAIDGLAEQVAAVIASGRCRNPILVGIHTGGYQLATIIHQRLEGAIELHAIDIALYRDDYTTRGIKLSRSNTRLPPRVDGTDIILIDDVLHTGRTIRSAMELLFSYGRPESVTLAVLIDRGGRQVPIQADLCGRRLDLAESRRIKLRFEDGRVELTATDQPEQGDVDHTA